MEKKIRYKYPYESNVQWFNDVAFVRAADFRDKNEAKEFIYKELGFKVKSFKEVKIIHRRYCYNSEEMGEPSCSYYWDYAKENDRFGMKAWQFYNANSEQYIYKFSIKVLINPVKLYEYIHLHLLNLKKRKVTGFEWYEAYGMMKGNEDE